MLISLQHTDFTNLKCVLSISAISSKSDIVVSWSNRLGLGIFNPVKDLVPYFLKLGGYLS